MDSGNNSASLQSSSTGGVGGGVGDEEYDSRAASQSFSTAFHTQNSSMFDPFINLFDPISRPQPPPLPPPSQNHTTTQNSIYDLEFHWNSKRIRTDQPNNPMLLPSSDFNNSLSFDTTTGSISFPSRSEEHHAVGGNVSATTITEQPAGSAAADQPQARNTKKRSRASRKAPTTVLTTDTTNFRAMVQEFTGIPGPPFTTPSYFPIRNRFDVFASAPNSAVRSVPPPPPPPAIANNNPNFFISQPSSNYLPRPFHQPPPPYLSPSSSFSPLVLNRLPINIASASSTTTSATNSAINYQLSTGVANSVAQGSNNFNSIQHNSIFTSLLQCSQKYPFGLKQQQQQFQMPSNNISQFQMPSNNISQFQMPSSMNSSAQHGHLLTELPNLISEEQAATASSINDNTINATNFHGNKVQETVNATNFHGDNLQETVVATNFHGDKVQETVAATKGVEGMVESWLLSTD
ncbi:uncharacterized protein LOC125855226 [Solanum stenotomum]|uniref:uncharacterized protein LOC125855226 n=1 Tax=Solanum stenotomum TaxID=172797 RepID=UPI0020D0E31B|nr:uncharacterized protein LOC125855226 [Solanum stenotomum]